MRKIDLTNKRFGKLIVLGSIEERYKGHIVWHCKCDCGNEVFIRGGGLTNDNNKSCGKCGYAGEISRRVHSKNGYCSAFNTLYRQYRQNAKKREYIFNLSEEEVYILVKQNCFYCGTIPLQISKPKYAEPFLYNGIDRIDNIKGYTINNVVTCCTICNQAKHKMTQEQFISWVINTAKHLKEKK